MATSTPINIITGRTGTAHVSSSDDAAIWRGFVGNDNVILSTDQKLSLDYSTKGSLVLSDGVLCVGGRMGRISNTKTVTYDIPASGYYRRTILLVRYSIASEVESMTLLTLQSDPSEDTSGADGASAAAELNINTSPTTDYVLYDFVCDEDGVVSGTMQTKLIVMDTIPALKSIINEETAAISGLSNRMTAAEAAQTTEAEARASGDSALSSRVSTLETWKNQEDATTFKLVRVSSPAAIGSLWQYVVCAANYRTAYAMVDANGTPHLYTVILNAAGTEATVTFSGMGGGSGDVVGTIKIVSE